MAKLRSEDAGKTTSKISQESKSPAPPQEPIVEEQPEVEEIDVTEIDDRITRLEEFVAHFSKFIEEAAPIIDGHDAKLGPIEAITKDVAVRMAALTTMINKFNAELSRLTGDLYRYSAENTEYHLALAKAVNDLAASLPEAVDKIITDYAAKAATEEMRKAEEKKPEKKK